MARLRNKNNKKIVKDIRDESLVAIYLGTNEWELVEVNKTVQPITNSIFEKKEEKKDKKVR